MINTRLGVYVTEKLNRNIRCIEIILIAVNKSYFTELNRNIRCIEIPDLAYTSSS